ncbi:MAG: transcription termination/antitermination protein NusG [bacterium]
MKWYVVHTQPGQEQKLKAALEKLIKDKNLEDKFGEILISEIEVESKDKNGKIRKRSKNLYSGYVFIEMEYDDESWALVKDVYFQRKPIFVGERKRFAKSNKVNKPMPVPPDQIAKIKKILEDGSIEEYQEVSFEVGENVTISEGAFSGFKAVIDTVNESKETLKVMVNVLGRSTPVEVGFSQVEKEED